MTAFNRQVNEWLFSLIDEGDALEIQRIRSMNDDASALTLAPWFIRLFNEEQLRRVETRNYSITHTQNAPQSAGSVICHGWNDTRHHVIPIDLNQALLNVTPQGSTLTFVNCSGSHVVFLKQHPTFELIIHNFVSNSTRVIPIPYESLSAADILRHPENQFLHVYMAEQAVHIMFVIFKVVSIMDVRVSMFDSFLNPHNQWQLLKAPAVFNANLDYGSLIFKPIIHGGLVYMVTVQNTQPMYQRWAIDIICDQARFSVKLGALGDRTVINRVASSANSHGNWIATILNEEDGLSLRPKKISLFRFDRASEVFQHIADSPTNLFLEDERMAPIDHFVEASGNKVQVAVLINGGGVVHARMFTYDIRTKTWNAARFVDLSFWRVSVPRLSSRLTI